MTVKTTGWMRYAVNVSRLRSRDPELHGKKDIYDTTIAIVAGKHNKSQTYTQGKAAKHQIDGK